MVSDLRQDMAGFDKAFGLPAPRMQVVSSLAGSSASPWLSFGEETLDAEMVHAIAPRAAMTIVLLNPADLTTPAASAAALTAMLKIGNQARRRDLDQRRLGRALLHQRRGG